MNLEDHLGDVLRKARMMNQLQQTIVAKAAGLTEAELAALEDSGQIAKPPNFAALATLLELSPAKLQDLAKGWLPSPRSLTAWRQLRAYNTTGDGTAVNCYLIWDGSSREAALFDTGWDASVILETIAHENLLLRHIFITHSHHDHVAALHDLRTAQPQAHVHCNTRSAPPDQRNQANECIQLGGLRITHRDTPGHAEDGVTYVVTGWPAGAPPVALVGDAIFAGSMGGAPQKGLLARQAVREQILSLPNDALLCSGHGPVTTVSEEKEHNPFF